MKTYKQWSTAKVPLGKFLEVGDEIDQELFDQMLGSVPPLIYTRNGFLVGEPYSYNDQGVDIYYHFSSVDGIYRFEGFHTFYEFKHWRPTCHNSSVLSVELRS